VISQHLHASVVPPRAKRAEVPPLLNELILRLLSKRPEDRPASAAEVLEALQRSDLLDPEARAAQELRVIDRIARGRFVGRQQELNEAREIWTKVGGGQGQTLLISGEPGIGKTRLMRELATHIEVTGGRTLVGTCYAEGGAPYAPFAQIIRRTLGEGSPNGLPLTEFVLADLLSLAPDLRARHPNVPPNPPLEPQAEQQRLFENMVAFCGAVSEQAPVMVVLDDAHWADSGSLSLLRHLARRTRQKRVLLMATYREVELDEARPFHEVMLDLNRERLATRLKLARLNREETGALLAAIFEEEITPEFLAGIYRETEGNPFFIEEVCKALVEEGKLYFENGRWHRPGMDELEIPQSVRVAIQTRVATLPEPYQETLRLAAVLGREFDYDTLAKASELDENTLIEALEAAEHAQLIEEIGSNGNVTFSFLHALIPATLEESVHTLRRRKLHRQAAAAVEGLRPDDLEALAYHYGEAGDDSKALAYYTRAGERAAAAYANQEAESHFRAALNLAQAEAARADLYSQLGSALANQSRFREAIGAWQSAIELYRSGGDTDRVAWCYARSARAGWEDGDFKRGLELAQAGLQAVEGAPDSPDLADLLHETARAYHFNGVPDKAAALNQRALEMAERVNAVRTQAEALITYGVLDGVTAEKAVVALERAIAIAQAHQLPETESRARNNLAIMLGVYQGKTRAAREQLLAAAAIARTLGQSAQQLFFQSNATGWAIGHGELAVAAAEIDQMRELSLSIPSGSTSQVVFGRLLGDLLKAQGRLEQAAEHYRGVLQRAREGNLLQDIWFLGCSLADTLLRLGRPAEARELLTEAVEIGDKIGGREYPRILLAMLHAKQRENEAAQTRLREAEAEAEKNPSALAAAILTEARGQLAAATGDLDQASAHFEAASNQYTAMGMRLDRSVSRSAWAEILVEGGRSADRERALELYREAIAESDSMGADGQVERLRARLLTLGAEAG
jgi:tetratricopeptide (TPR) repeat protein